MRSSSVTLAAIFALLAAGYAVAVPAGSRSAVPVANRPRPDRATGQTLMVQMMGQGGMNGGMGAG
jgi:hypothetical protein